MLPAGPAGWRRMVWNSRGPFNGGLGGDRLRAPGYPRVEGPQLELRVHARIRHGILHCAGRALPHLSLIHI